MSALALILWLALVSGLCLLAFLAPLIVFVWWLDRMGKQRGQR